MDQQTIVAILSLIHNSFAERMPVVEEQIKVINHRLEDLEHENQRQTG